MKRLRGIIHPSCMAWFIVSLVIVWTGIVLAAVNTDTNSLDEHAQAIMSAQWWVIGGFCSALVIILKTLYSNIIAKLDKLEESLREDFKQLREGPVRQLFQDKLDIDAHREIDHSHLCAFCEDMHTERRKKDR